MPPLHAPPTAVAPARKLRRPMLLAVLALVAILGSVRGVGADDLTARVQSVTLENGLRIYVLERPFSPTFAGYYQFQVGGTSDPKGRSGIAHLLEHMMFKGTTTVGTTNWKREQVVMAELSVLWEELHALLEAQDDPFAQADPDRIAHLRDRIDDLTTEQKNYVVQNEYDEIMSRNGGRSLNASTGSDRTNYFLQLPANMLELWFFLEAERLTHPVFREFYSERDVVAEERRLRVDNRPDGLAWEALNRLVYQAHPYGTPVIGWEDDLRRLRREDAEAYFKTYYSPSNCVMVLVGDVEVDEVRRLAEKYLGSWEQQVIPRLEFTEEPVQRGERRQVIEFEAEPQLFLAWRTVPEGHPDQYPLEILARVLGGMASARLERALVQEGRIASRVRAVSSTQRYGGDFSIFGAPRGEHDNAELEAAILTAIETIQENGVGSEEVERAKVASEVARLRRLESNLALAMRIGSTVGTTGGLAYLDDYPARIAAVTPAEVQDVAQRYFGRSQLNAVEVVRREGAGRPARGGGEPERGAEAAAAGARGERHSLGFGQAMNLASLAPRTTVAIPEIGKDVERVVLSSGITVFLREDHELPVVRMQCAWLGGSNSTEVDDLAPFELASRLLLEGGTEALSPAEVEVRRDELGMSFDLSIGGTESRANLWSLARSFEESFGLAADLLRRPRLDAERLEVLVGQYVQSMQERADDPGRGVEILTSRILYGDHPRLGRVVSREEIEALRPEEIEEALDRYLGRDNLFVTVVGDFARDEVLALIESRLGSWEPAEEAERTWVTREPSLRPGVFIVEKDLPQPAVRITQELPIDRSAPEAQHAALEIANAILGGSGFRSRLMERLRTNEGLTYGVRSSLLHEGRPGVPGRLTVSYQTKQESVARSVDIVLEELEKMKYGAISPQELEEQVQSWRNGFVFRYDNPFRTVAGLMDAEIDDRPYGHESERLAAIEALRVGDVMTAAKSVIDPAQVTIAIFGQITPEDEAALAARFRVTKLAREEVFLGGYEVVETTGTPGR